MLADHICKPALKAAEVCRGQPTVHTAYAARLVCLSASLRAASDHGHVISYILEGPPGKALGFGGFEWISRGLLLSNSPFPGLRWLTIPYRNDIKALGFSCCCREGLRLRRRWLQSPQASQSRTEQGVQASRDSTGNRREWVSWEMHRAEDCSQS